MSVALLFATSLAVAAEERIPVPPELQKEVNFWIRVYTEITTSEGFLHDQNDLGIVYRTLHFNSDVQPGQRRDAVDEEREKIEKMLRHLAAGDTDLNDEEKRIAAAFGAAGTPARFAEAANSVRFQLGQSDRFREGLERSSQWEAHIEQAFANLGLPPELAALPHVESSFDPTAYSKVGAAGLWQFMRATGRRYLRIDDAVDERMDPFRATEAAAQLLDYNYRFLGTWPLALTAYNHGAAGMRRAADSLNTTDIATIIRDYKSPTFGFASRNFFVSFLAALTIERDPEKYFPKLQPRPELSFTEVELPAYVPLAVLQKTLKVDRATLLQLNPAFRPALIDGSRYVPKGYKLRLPAGIKDLTSARLAQQISLSDQYINQPSARSYKVRKGDSLADVAKRTGIPAATIAQLNDLSGSTQPRAGRTLRLPEQAATRVSTVVASTPARPGAVAPPAPVVAAAGPATAPVAEVAEEPAPQEEISKTLAEQREEVAAIARTAKDPEPVSAAEAKAEGPSLVPGGGAVARSSEAIDYGVAADQTIRVAAEETLGHYADWLGVSANRLRTLNKLNAGTNIVIGRKLKLDFSKAKPAQFEARRRDFHEQLEAAFFANHRIAGTQVYVARRGDSLWNVAQRNGGLPAWLVLHYNPDVDFGALRAGLEIVIPKVELLPSG
ncbi:MAG: transglycosylase SLT domain-containing protein [Pseudomonadota bacterium]